MRTLTNEISNKIGEEVELKGWVRARRDHGKIIFIDLRDRWGFVQVVFTPKIAGAADLRLEYVIEVRGMAKNRPANMVDGKSPNGAFEIEAKELKILNMAEPLPIPVDTDGYEIDEESRLKYRYLDIRRDRLKNNLILRHRVIKFIRDFLSEGEFLEIETPHLTKSTPEGARDYIVPSRLQKGKFYALPQSPQQYKQLLMAGGIEKYFQIARCFRDEDTRGDRQPEFTQLDLEMSFVEEEDIMNLNEELLIALVKAVAPDKNIQDIPFQRRKYEDVIKDGTDRPDLRKDKNDPNLLAFCWVTDFPFFERDESKPGLIGKIDESSRNAIKLKAGGWTFTHNPFSAPIKEHVDRLINGWDDDQVVAGIYTTQYDIVLNGLEIGGGSIRNSNPDALKKVFKILGFDDDRIESNFGHMIKALSLGAPPHGGIAWGLDRLISILAGEPNIREVIAFPKTGDGRDLMMSAPSEVDPQQLDELGLTISKKSLPEADPPLAGKVKNI